ncbi:MAG TPA: cytidine deaminase [Acidimicrobiales bacterium]|nr:cytidine deaminase [Acidimicrobiales bacterium]
MSGSSSIDWGALRATAREAARTSYSPYSHVRVGAAGLTDAGAIVRGANVENSSYGLSLCAECSLVSDLARLGGGRLVAVAVVGGEGAPMAPCGRCRQLLVEFGGPELLVDGGEGSAPTRLGDLLPGAFGPEDLSRTEP